MSDSDMFETVALIVGALPVAIILITVFVKLFGFFRNLFSDKIQYEAVVLKRDRKTEYRNNRVSKHYSIPYRLDIFFITFRTSKHKKLRLKVDGKDYRAVKEGNTGMLTLQGKKFISFEKKAENSYDNI